MKNIILLIALLVSLVAVNSVNAQGAPAANAYGLTQSFELDRNFSIGLLDTLVAVDSVTLLNRVALSQDYDYIVRIGATTGSGSDSVEVILRADCFAGSGDTTRIWYTSFDTVTTAIGEEIICPINRTMHGKKYTLKAYGGAKNGGVVILNDWSLLKRKTFR